MTVQAQLLPGTLDLLILKAVSLGPLHGYGILLRIEQISGGALLIEQGALYPALFRLVRQGLLKASWGISENNRRAKFYELTSAGTQTSAGGNRQLESPRHCYRSALSPRNRRKYEILRLSSFLLCPVSFIVLRSTGRWRRSFARTFNIAPTTWSVPA